MHELEQSISQEGSELFKAIKSTNESLFDKQYWLGRMMEWVMKDQSFKVDLFRFVDVLPALVTKDQVAKHIQEYLLQKDRELPQFVGPALKAASFSFARVLAASAIRKNVTEIAQRFIAGKDIKSAAKILTKLNQEGFSTTIDLLGEKVLSNQESDVYFERYQEIIAALPAIVSPALGNVSIKVSALSCHLHEEDPEFGVKSAKERIMPLLRLARFHKVFINFDVESYETQEIIYKLFHEIIMSEEYKTWPHLGIVIQAYLKNSPAFLNSLLEACKIRKTPITIRLVKGAYWDYELVRAEQRGIECPVFKQKAETDHNFENLSKIMLENSGLIRPAFGSHNIRSLAHVIAYAKKRHVNAQDYEIQMLYGMAEAERKALLAQNQSVRVYVPVGDTLVGMSYLVRRLLENTSQMGFLRLSHHENLSQEALLAPPLIKNIPDQAPASSFTNQASLDFTKSSERSALMSAINNIQTQTPFKIPLMIGGEIYKHKDTLVRPCPNDTIKIFSHSALADNEAALQAIKQSHDIFPEFKSTALNTRIEHVLNLAEILRQDRYVLTALMCHEVAKTWAEADAELCEAIDFCKFYASRAPLELGLRPLGLVSGEDNSLYYQGRGPSAIIAPWNFPLAILCGMSVAAYLAGNPIIIKPAEQSCVTAYFLYQRMLKAGFIPKATHFLPGRGEEIGVFLCEHPEIANICFTGSKAVGLEILKRSFTPHKSTRLIKRVVAEMGGKNAIIVDDDADLDEAVLGVLKSAFGYAGQKCSAASRVIIIGDIKELFCKRLSEAADSMITGSSLNAQTQLGPVIDEEAYDRLQLKIKDLQVDPALKIWHLGENLSGGYFVPSVIVEAYDPKHWVMQEELFGPILALYAAQNLEEAISVANLSSYALTGAVYSRSPQNIQIIKDRFNVGNLYINQKCTGAQVNRQPFGGFKMSGTGPKAGGFNYVTQFADAKAISENTMRRGFTPDISL